ncbi:MULTISPECIES: PTS sugar transporter subunit IIC [unclassified Clostridium]|jgi:fructose-specific phosphotransferase system IIC component|uniref:PTS sugar transporter subunit IIC n=1 Tax=Clostridium TaxID=1485 RepID=UPI0018AC825C|nr:MULTISPECIES: PTS sugar transporter subunit IIC [unclassified Clostridium]MDU2122770.1 PTS sugar transporter subunit IIC [Clostridium celatum]MBS4957573.1 PTS sugar transporter subunit IIC [Clostridium sp.]MBX9139154.1 PTS sugar transporter subunit IIC [Clostridium sp. K12(2020)]MBX9144882.1 PTS sugar transporter subunit IIC [Clostridium sp. K13]MDU2291358.1 PTS sugar transporter subunit IIC [Clostridium celatum]
MNIIFGTILLLIVLGLFTLFSYKAPNGMKAMGALANAACASFLVEAFHDAFFGGVLNIGFLQSVGAANGSLGGVAAAILVPLALGVSPVYAVLVGLACSGFGILPGFIAGYLISYVIKFLEKKVPAGLDLIAIIIIAAPLSRLIASGMTPIVNSTLLKIGDVLLSSANSSPIIMGIILGGILTVVATAPLSSMALTAMLGLTGVPMAIGALAVFGSSFMNYVFFGKMKFGSKKDTIAVAIEPLTQADIISANPIPVYVTNFIGGALSGIIVSLMGLVNMTPGTATPIAGFAVMFAYNPAIKVLIAAAGCILVSVISGYIGYFIFKNKKILTADEIRNPQAA